MIVGVVSGTAFCIQELIQKMVNKEMTAIRRMRQFLMLIFVPNITTV